MPKHFHNATALRCVRCTATMFSTIFYFIRCPYNLFPVQQQQQQQQHTSLSKLNNFASFVLWYDRSGCVFTDFESARADQLKQNSSSSSYRVSWSTSSVLLSIELRTATILKCPSEFLSNAVPLCNAVVPDAVLSQAAAGRPVPHAVSLTYRQPVRGRERRWPERSRLALKKINQTLDLCQASLFFLPLGLLQSLLPLDGLLAFDLKGWGH